MPRAAPAGVADPDDGKTMSSPDRSPDAPDTEPTDTAEPTQPAEQAEPTDDQHFDAVDALDDEAELDLAAEMAALSAEPAEPGLAARLGAEAFGTFALVLVTLGVTLYTPLSGVGTLGVAVAAGLVLAGLTAAFGHVSGAHVNPLVTLASAIAGRLRWADAALYWPAQVLGGGAAAATLFLTVPDGLAGLLGLSDSRALFSTTVTAWGEHSSLWTATQETAAFDARAAFIVELVAGAVLAAVVLGAANRHAATLPVAPVAIGLTYAALLLLAAPISGGALNPARATGAALFAESWAWGQLWLYWLAPLLGAAIAALLYRAFREPEYDVVLVDQDAPGDVRFDG